MNLDSFSPLISDFVLTHQLSIQQQQQMLDGDNDLSPIGGGLLLLPIQYKPIPDVIGGDTMTHPNEMKEIKGIDNNDKTTRDEVVQLDKLNDANKKWTLEEDIILCKMHEMYGNHWSLIACFLPGRTRIDTKVRHRSIVRASKKFWTREQRELLLSLYKKNSSCWNDEFLLTFPGRTKHCIRMKLQEILKDEADSKNFEVPAGSPFQVFHHNPNALSYLHSLGKSSSSPNVNILSCSLKHDEIDPMITKSVSIPWNKMESTTTNMNYPNPLNSDGYNDSNNNIDGHHSMKRFNVDEFEFDNMRTSKKARYIVDDNEQQLIKVSNITNDIRFDDQELNLLIKSLE